MNNTESATLPALTYEGGTRAMTLTPVIGTPRREYGEMFVPGEEPLEDGELRVTVLGSGNPWPTRAQASASVLVEVGNAERDILVFDLGTGSVANYASLKLPVNKLNKVFLTHLHADHMGDVITLGGSLAKVGRADGPVYVWDLSEPSRGSEPVTSRRRSRKHWPGTPRPALAPSIRTACGSSEPSPTSARPRSSTRRTGVKVTSFPVVHCISGAVGYRLDFGGVSFAYSGDTRPCWPLVRACEGVDVLIHECFPPAAALAAASGLSIERATIALNAAHTSPTAAGKVFSLVKPKLAGLWHTLLSPQVVPAIFAELRSVYDGAVVQTQDLTVIGPLLRGGRQPPSVGLDQLPLIPGHQCVSFQPVAVPPPDWWAEALISVD
ncbi:MAG: MBL fold metallo-hydrolase [Blastocatellia bacterium]|nr:MBL fold metallo-hydrolase [Blastocatellia bacterium]